MGQSILSSVLAKASAKFGEGGFGGSWMPPEGNHPCSIDEVEVSEDVNDRGPYVKISVKHTIQDGEGLTGKSFFNNFYLGEMTGQEVDLPMSYRDFGRLITVIAGEEVTDLELAIDTLKGSIGAVVQVLRKDSVSKKTGSTYRNVKYVRRLDVTA